MTQSVLFNFEKKTEESHIYPIEDSIGFFILNGIKIRFEFKKEYICDQPHCEFYSVENNKPNFISETGYRSWFLMEDEIEPFKTMNEVIEHFIKDFNKPYCLRWHKPKDSKC